MTVSTRALTCLADTLRQHRATLGTRWRRALQLLAARAPTLEQAIEVARAKAYVILDGTLLRIDRVGMTGGHDRPYYSGKHSVTG